MPVIYELRGKMAAYCDLGVNLFNGCTVGCRELLRLLGTPCELGTVDQQSAAAQEYSVSARREAKQIEGDPREIGICPGPDPYQSDEAARLTRKALLILEQYHLRVQIATLCGTRSTADFDILARNRWKYSYADSLSVGTSARGVGARRRANRRADRDPPSGPCGGNLDLGQAPSHRRSGWLDRRGRVATERSGCVESRQIAPRSSRRPSRSPVNGSVSSTRTPPWHSCDTWLKGA